MLSKHFQHHDVAILVIDSPVSYSESIQPICLANEGSDFTGEEVTVSGWGLLWENVTRVKKLKQTYFFQS